MILQVGKDSASSKIHFIRNSFSVDIFNGKKLTRNLRQIMRRVKVDMATKCTSNLVLGQRLIRTRNFDLPPEYYS
jgi:hypothetical protein